MIISTYEITCIQCERHASIGAIVWNRRQILLRKCGKTHTTCACRFEAYIQASLHATTYRLPNPSRIADGLGTWSSASRREVCSLPWLINEIYSTRKQNTAPTQHHIWMCICICTLCTLWIGLSGFTVVPTVPCMYMYIYHMYIQRYIQRYISRQTRKWCVCLIPTMFTFVTENACAK